MEGLNIRIIGRNSLSEMTQTNRTVNDDMVRLGFYVPFIFRTRWLLNIQISCS